MSGAPYVWTPPVAAAQTDTQEEVDAAIANFDKPSLTAQGLHGEPEGAWDAGMQDSADAVMQPSWVITENDVELLGRQVAAAINGEIL